MLLSNPTYYTRIFSVKLYETGIPICITVGDIALLCVWNSPIFGLSRAELLRFDFNYTSSQSNCMRLLSRPDLIYPENLGAPRAQLPAWPTHCSAPNLTATYCTISFNSAVPCPQLRWFGRNRFPVQCPPPMWPTPKCGLRNASKLVIFENPYSRVYFPTIRGLIVLDHSCTLIERNY